MFDDKKRNKSQYKGIIYDRDFEYFEYQLF